MSFLASVAILLTITAALSFINEKFLKWECSLGLTFCTLVAAVLVIALRTSGVTWADQATEYVASIAFSETFLHGTLCFLLFAGALDVPLAEIECERKIIAALALGATLIATLLIGISCWLLLGLIGIDIPLAVALLFGAIISPTDPIAALAILRSAGLPKRLEGLIDGESLFNDGIGVVLVTLLLGIATGSETAAPGTAVQLFLYEVVGAIVLGLTVGAATHFLLAGTTTDTSRLLVTVAAVTGAFALGEHIGVSALIATVILGLIVGNFSLRGALEQAAAERLNVFWGAVDQLLNSTLFVLIGMHALLIDISGRSLAAMSIAIVCVLAGRWISVAVPLGLAAGHDGFNSTRLQLVNLLTWSGLRGGLSIALALSLPPEAERSLLVAMVYGTACFSIIVQGLTIRRFFPQADMQRMADLV